MTSVSVAGELICRLIAAIGIDCQDNRLTNSSLSVTSLPMSRNQQLLIGAIANGISLSLSCISNRIAIHDIH
jgi:hypothetical protein